MVMLMPTKKEKELARQLFKERLERDRWERKRGRISDKDIAALILIGLFFLVGLIVWWPEIVEMWNLTVVPAITDLLDAFSFKSA